MSLTITVPYRNTLNDSAPCIYFAIHNPLVIKCERNDFVVVDTQDDGTGLTQINISGGGLPALTAGGLVYLQTGVLGAGIYGTFVIVSATASIIIINLAFGGAYTGGFVNLTTDRKNYFVYTRLLPVYPTFPDSGGLLQYIYRKDKPDTDGVAKIDVAENLRTKFTAKNLSPFTAVDSIDTNNCVQYTVEFLEVWDTSTESWSGINYVTAVNAALQVQNTGGSCMVNYITSGVNDAALFLTDSNTQRFWPGLPFDNQILLMNDDFKTFMDANPGLALSRLEKTFAADGTSVQTATTLSGGGALFIIDTYKRLMVAGGYASDIVRVEVSIAYEYAPGLFQKITNTLNVRVESGLPCNPAYLSWLNQKGGWNYYCFGQRQQLGSRIASAGEFAQSFEDLQTQDTTSSFLGKDAEDYMILGGDQFDGGDISLLQSLIKSPRVFLLMNASTWGSVGPFWREMKIEVGDFKTFDTGKRFNNFEFRMRLPETYLQRT